MKVEEMFVLMDGTQADPNDVARGVDGVWRHKNGVKVAMHADGRPETVGDRAALNGSPASRDAADKAHRQPSPDELPVDGAHGDAVQEPSGDKPPSEEKPPGEA